MSVGKYLVYYIKKQVRINIVFTLKNVKNKLHYFGKGLQKKKKNIKKEENKFP